MSTKSRDRKSSSGVTRKSLQGGSALIIGLVAVVATALLVAGIGKMVQARATVTVDSLLSAQAIYAAESALIRRLDPVAGPGENTKWENFGGADERGGNILYVSFMSGGIDDRGRSVKSVCSSDDFNASNGAKLAVGRVTGENGNKTVHRLCVIQLDHLEQSVLYIEGDEKFTPPDRGGSLSILGEPEASLKFPGAPASSYDTLCSNVGEIDMPGSQSGKLPFAQGHFVCQEDKPRECEGTILGIKEGKKVFDSDEEFGGQNKICRDAICFHRDVGSWPAECPMGPPSPKYTEWEYAR